MSQQLPAANRGHALQPPPGFEPEDETMPIRQLRNFAKLSENLNGAEAANRVLSATIEHTRDGIMAVDGNGEIVACNRRFLEMWGISNDALPCGDSDKLLLSLLGQVRDPVLFFENFSEMQWQPNRESYDVVELNDGRCFERFSRPHYLDWKTAVRIWTFHDISELKKMESQLLHAQKMEAIGTLADGIAHDFNNIMTAVIGYTDLLMTELSPPAPYRGFLENINTATHRAITVVKNLLAYSRQEPMQTTRILGNDLIEGIFVLLKRVAGQGIELAWEPAPDTLPIMVDQAQMEQVLVNLTANARDAMPQGGTLTITVDAVDLAPHEVQGYDHTRPGPHVRIAVSDTGSGIDQETQSRIFDPFFTTKEAGNGTGLGLSISYGIVKRHGGFIRVASENGEGTTFSILLPKAEASPNRQKQPAPSN
uniref:histidine kinase n=1 Tax=Geobacter sp. (strain M21) TaxID=443144 RepID=C6DZZ9_GEOSM